jgi:hypothetical protein
MKDTEFFDWLKTCPSSDWSVIDATTTSVKVKFPIKLFKELDKSLLLVHNVTSSQLWITDSELEEANKKALEIFDGFYLNEGDGEEIWEEIEVNNKFYDINCWDEGISQGCNAREGAVHCTIYPLEEDAEGYRFNDGCRCIRLFTVDKSIGED